ncbi:hypothetical protein PMAYCL1PPCAC_33050, partial [Pristionchus mayeri]
EHEITWLVNQNCSIVAYSTNNFETWVTIVVSAMTAIGITVSTSSLAALCLRVLNNNAPKISQRTKTIQLKLTKRLIVQTIFPISLLGSPLIVYCGSIAF